MDLKIQNTIQIIEKSPLVSKTKMGHPFRKKTLIFEMTST
jgi:hypothetical protein